MTMMQTGSLELISSGPSATSADDTSTFQEVFFPTPFPHDASVIVIPMIQTFNGPHTPGLRLTDVTHTGFKIRMNELVGPQILSDGNHRAETVGWVAYTV